MQDRAELLTVLTLAIFRTNGVLIATGDALTAPFGLSSARWQVMGAIALAEQALTVARISRNMGLTRQGVQRLIDELEKHGFVDFQDNPHHKRAKLIRLTAQGHQAFDAIMQQWNARAARLAEGMDTDSLNAAIGCLEQLSNGLDADRPPD